MAFTLLRQATVLNQAGSIIKIENGGSSGPSGANRGEWRVGKGRSYTSRLKVQTNSPYVGSIQIIQSVAPVWGAYYRWPLIEYNGTNAMPLLPVEQDTGSFLQSIACDPDGDDGKQWILTLEYGPFDVAHELGDQQENGVIDPTSKKPEASWGTGKYERSKTQDESDPPQPYINTVGDPLVDPPKTEEGRPVLTITRGEYVYNESWLNSFVDHVNSDVFLGYPPNTVKCKDITGKRVYDADWGYYWDITYEFEVRDDPDGHGWDELVLNAGTREKKNGSGNPVTVMVSGAPVSEPVALQENGSYDPNADPVYLVFKLFRHAPFAELAIPEDILTAQT